MGQIKREFYERAAQPTYVLMYLYIYKCLQRVRETISMIRRIICSSQFKNACFFLENHYTIVGMNIFTPFSFFRQSANIKGPQISSANRKSAKLQTKIIC
jgi:hypothetical protein